MEKYSKDMLSMVTDENGKSWINFTNEMSVFYEWLDIFVENTRGKVASTEGYAQDVIKMQTLFEYFKASDKNYMIKSKILDFVFNA